MIIFTAQKGRKKVRHPKINGDILHFHLDFFFDLWYNVDDKI
jgi:hypothetical protein